MRNACAADTRERRRPGWAEARSRNNERKFDGCGITFGAVAHLVQTLGTLQSASCCPA